MTANGLHAWADLYSNGRKKKVTAVESLNAGLHVETVEMTAIVESDRIIKLLKLQKKEMDTILKTKNFALLKDTIQSVATIIESLSSEK